VLSVSACGGADTGADSEEATADESADLSEWTVSAYVFFEPPEGRAVGHCHAHRANHLVDLVANLFDINQRALKDSKQAVGWERVNRNTSDGLVRGHRYRVDCHGWYWSDGAWRHYKLASDEARAP